MPPARQKSTEEMARRRAKYLTGLAWHVGTFVIIGVFFAALDLLGDARLNWSLWILGAWTFALAFHAFAYLVDGTSLQDRKTRQYLSQAGRRESERDGT
jgi:hypothetical protein